MDERCLLTPYIIKRELECLAGMVGASTTLIQGYDAEHDAYRFRWNVDENFFIVVTNVPAEDMRLSLDDFSRKHCARVVETMRNSLVRECLRPVNG